MNSNVSKRLLLLGVVLFFGGCTGDSSGDPTAGPRVEINPSTVLLTRTGEAHQLEAQAFDAAGDPIEVEVTWESSSDDVVVDSSGQVTASAAVGSALITAKFENVASRPATVMVAEPADEALLVTDAQVVEQPVAVDSNARREIGTRYTVVLSGVEPPASGSLVLAKEDSPIAGRVVSSEVRGGDVIVTLEAVPITELFRNLNLTQAFPLSIDDFVPENDQVTVTKNPEGSLTLHYDLGDDEGEVTPTLKGGGSTNFRIGDDVQCKASARPMLVIRSPTLKIVPDVKFDSALVVEDWELKRLMVRLAGSLTATANLRALLTASFRGTAKCRLRFGNLRLPVGGALSALFSLSVPIGVGIDLEGNLEVAEAALGVEGSASLSLTAGFEYTNFDGFRSLNDFEATASLNPVVEFPGSLFEDLRITGSVHGYTWSGFTLEALPFLEALDVDLDFQFLDINLGPRFNVTFATRFSQVVDPGYASEYKLSLFGKAGLSDSVKDMLKWFGGAVQIIPVEFRFERLLFRSPQGTLNASTLDAVAGVPLQLRARLNDDTVNFFRLTSPLSGEYSVREVGFYRVDEDSTELLAAVQPNESGQLDFSTTWEPTESDTGLNTFAAFVMTEPFTYFSLFPLEIAPDSLVRVNVRSPDEPPPAAFIFLGAFEGSGGLRLSRGNAINDQGLATGVSSGVPQGKAFRWQNGVGLTDLGSPVSEPQDAVNLGGAGINSSGHVVGTFRSTFFPPDGMAPKFDGEQPFVWMGGAMVSLNESLDLDVWKQLRNATDINDNGSIVGLGVFRLGDSTRGRGYIYRNGEATQLSTLGTDTNFSQPKAVNNFNQVVGVVTTPNGQDKVGFLWDGSIQEIKPDGFPESEANDINDEGQIVGWAGQTNSVLSRAFLWLPQAAYGLPAGMNLLEFPTCVSNPSGGSASAINNKGQILVSTACGWGIWEQGQLTEIVPPDNTVSIKLFTDINNNGQAVGYGAMFDSTDCNGTDCALVVNFEGPK